ncbi:hypothetical protein B0187_00045 [Haemophilus paracuniculus]|uniref:Uncharacterized protein n=1 Tax=Haemophilus paracuniculus TaxID=734 RepID=A0A1T0AVB3_9PAST|nr:hypothetical protein [Haemophilus paracuniculus]OOS00729.1 hypothetical protein B0187_00045 [Haemophilus paracuniculus]
MKKSLFLGFMSILLGINSTQAVQLYPAKEVPIIVTDTQPGQFSIGLRDKDEQLIVKNVTAKSTNGDDCKLKFRADFTRSGKQIIDQINDTMLFYQDVSESGCYPQMKEITIETENMGTWVYNLLNYKYKKLGYTADPNEGNVTVEIDDIKVNPGSFKVKITSKVNNYYIQRIAPKTNCYSRVYARLPNSNRTEKTLNKGDSVTYEVEGYLCDITRVQGVRIITGPESFEDFEFPRF